MLTVLAVIVVTSSWVPTVTELGPPRKDPNAILQSTSEVKPWSSVPPTLPRPLPQIGASIQVGTSPGALVYDPIDGDTYVANVGSHNVTVISGTSERVVATIGGFCVPYALAVDRATGDVYVANYDCHPNTVIPDNVIVISSSTQKVKATVTVGSWPVAIAYDEDNGAMYVANTQSSNVSVINTSTNRVVTSIFYNQSVGGLVFDSANGNIYVQPAAGISGPIAIINGSTNRITGTIPVGYPIQDMLANPRNGSLYVDGPGDGYVTNNSLSLISGATGKVEATLKVEGPIGGMAFDPRTGLIYLAGGTPGNVSIIDSTKAQFVGTIPMGTLPGNLVINESSNWLFVIHEGSDNVSIIDLTTDRVVANAPVGATPVDMVQDASTGDVYVSNFGGSAVSVLGPSYLSFSQYGLPKGTTWTLSIGGQTYAGRGGILSGSVGRGNWTYAVTDVPGFHQPSLPYAGNVSILANDSITTEPLMIFTKVTYSLTFVETGLKKNQSWAVNLSGEWNESRGGVVGFHESNGSYNYQCETLGSALYGTLSGTIRLNGSALSVQVAFSVVRYAVTFSEAGLPAGLSWVVNLSGQWNGTTSTSISFLEPNGTYPFVAISTQSCYIAERSSVTVVGLPVRVNLSFLPCTGPPPSNVSALFTETGLPTGTAWSVAVTVGTRNSTFRSTNESIALSLDGPGFYPYRVLAPMNFSATPSTGTLNLTASSKSWESVGVVFEPVAGLWAAASVSAVSGAYCSSGAFTLTFVGSAGGGTPPYRYEWSFGGGASSAVGAVVTHSFAAGTASGPSFSTLTVYDAANRSAHVSVPSSAVLCSPESASAGLPVWVPVALGALGSLVVASIVTGFVLVRRRSRR